MFKCWSINDVMFLMSPVKLFNCGLWQIAVSWATSTGSTQHLATYIPMDKKVSYGTV